MRFEMLPLVATLLGLFTDTNAFTPTSFSHRAHLTSSASSRSILYSTSPDQSLNARKEISPLSYAAAGSPTVDMNKYNLSLDQVVNEWSAVLQPGSSMQEEGIFLQPKNKRALFVDCLQYRLKREGGLGLILTELAGGREDGVGITIVEEVLEGGNAEHSGIVAGDSIVALTVKKSSNDADPDRMVVDEQRIDVSTECLAYDPTIEALTSLPPPTSSDEEIILTVKRIRRQPKINIKLQYPPETNEDDVSIELFAGENLRRAMLTRGIKLNDKLSERFDSGGTGDCGAEGTCSTCVVSITKGMDMLSPIGIQESQILSKKPKWRMACKTVVGYGMSEGEMTIQVNPRQWPN